MQKVLPLQPGCYYHVYNNGNNHEDIFCRDRDYRHFLKLYSYHLCPLIDTFSYCMLRNHFHLLVRTRLHSEICADYERTTNYSQAFSNFFNAYTQSFNLRHKRSGKLFTEHFKRILVDSDAYFSRLVYYIHRNPEKHGFVDDFQEWPWSSYHNIARKSPGFVDHGTVLNWFGNVEAFKLAHREQQDSAIIEPLIAETFL